MTIDCSSIGFTEATAALTTRRSLGFDVAEDTLDVLESRTERLNEAREKSPGTVLTVLQESDSAAWALDTPASQSYGQAGAAESRNDADDGDKNRTATGMDRYA